MKKKIIIILIVLAITIPLAIIFFKKVLPRYINPYGIFGKSDSIRLVVGTKDETSRLANPIIIEGNRVLFSYENMNRFIDAYILKDKKYNKVITNSKTHTKIIDIDTQKMREYLSNDLENVYIKQENGTIYFDINELKDVYDIDVNYIKKTNTVDIKKDIHTYEMGVINAEKTNFMKLPSNLCIKIGKFNQGERVYVLGTDKEYYKILDNQGRFGYVLQSQIGDISEVTNYVDPTENKKINLVWEYAESSTPIRTGEKKIDSLDVVSPTWFQLMNDKGEFINRTDYSYINWANSVGYEIWPLVSNGSIIIQTSTVLNDYVVREKMVSYLLENCKKYGFKGINMDFEYIYMKDKDAYSQFIRELSVEFRKNGLVVSVDVTVPDGSENYSLCYDRQALGEAVDYLILMAYDQTSQNSSIPGSNAANDWVETNIKKLLEVVDKEKLVLAIPLYTRIWTVTDNDVKSTAITISRTMSLIDSNRAQMIWLDDKKQNYTEYYLGRTKYVIWVEDLKSIEEKLKLYKTYELGGTAYWKRDSEFEGLWDLVKQYTK